MFMKKILFIVLAALLVPALASAQGKVKIGISIPTADHGWTGGINWWAQKAIKDWQAKDKNVEFVLVTADNPQKQVNDVEDLMSRGITALVILAHDSATLTPVVKRAFEKGIYVVSVDRGLTEVAQNVYIAGDNPGFGALCAEWLGKALGGKGEIVMMEGIPTVINTERVEAFKAVMKKKYPGIKILESQPAYWDTQKGLALMENYLQKYKKIDAVWAQDDDVLVGVLQAYKESGRNDIKIMLGGAGSKVMVKKVMDGDALVKADVTYSPSMIATGITLGVLGAQGKGLDGFYQKKIPSKIVLSAELVTKENAKDYYFPDSVY
jgi:ribose transport system substrate-binding protein